MQIGLLGVNHKSADVNMREKVSKACLMRLSRDSAIAMRYRCVVLSTCNRIEIYFSSENLAEAHSALIHLLREEMDADFEHTLYSLFGLDCFIHLVQVASGQDSAVIAESEIQHQVKVAYEQTVLHYPLPSCIHYLFQKSLKLSKQIRSHFSLAQNRVTVAKTLFQVSENLVKSLKGLPILFVGNSEINRKVMAYFKCKGVKQMSLCTRSPFSAMAMAEKEGLSLLAWENISLWQNYPIVVCGSNVSHFILTKPKEMVHTRLIFDLALPRNVDPSLAKHPQLVLFNIEELMALMEQKQEKNGLEIARAREWTLDSVQRYYDLFQSKGSRVLICI